MTSARPQRKLDLDPATVRRARSLARTAGAPIVRLARTHTTVSVERAVLRLAGVSGADPDGIPWVNRLVDEVREQVGLEHGVALPVWDALRRSGEKDVTTLAQRAATGGVRFEVPEAAAADRAATASTRSVRRGVTAIDRRRTERERLVARIGDAPSKPWIYLIVATGDIYEDIPQAQAA
ncbi:MAG: lysine 5,6-aminomutase subunit alpha, partial [Sporichthyaceae bacterium]